MKYKKIEIVNHCEETRKNKKNPCSNCLISSVCDRYFYSIPCIDGCEKWSKSDLNDAYNILYKEKNIKHLSDLDFECLTENELSQFSYEEILYNLRELDNRIEELEIEIEELY